MISATLAARIAREFGTPSLVVDLDVVERNIARTQALCEAAGVANRPHIKTHKIPRLAQMQRDAGARGIVCQKVGEAEVMIDAGLDDVLISYNVLGEDKVARLGALLARAKVTVATDNPVTVAGLPPAGLAAGRELPVVVEVRHRPRARRRGHARRSNRACPRHRVAPGPALRRVHVLPARGGQGAHATLPRRGGGGGAGGGSRARHRLLGGTPNLMHLGLVKGFTEHRAGTSIFNDRMMMAASYATLEDCALIVVSTVVSRAAPERGILDAGSKTLTSDTGGLDGFGLIVDHPQARIAKFAEEHGFLDLAACNDRPKVGDVVRVVPNHVCPVVNLQDRVVAVRGTRSWGNGKSRPAARSAEDERPGGQRQRLRPVQATWCRSCSAGSGMRKPKPPARRVSGSSRGLRNPSRGQRTLEETPCLRRLSGRPDG